MAGRKPKSPGEKHVARSLYLHPDENARLSEYAERAGKTFSQAVAQLALFGLGVLEEHEKGGAQ